MCGKWVSVSIPEELYGRIERLFKKGVLSELGYTSVTDFVRDSVRDKLITIEMLFNGGFTECVSDLRDIVENLRNILDVEMTSLDVMDVTMVKRIIEKLEDTNVHGAKIEDIYKVSSLIGIDKEKVDKILERLKRNGEVYQPVVGYYRVVKFE